MAVTGLCKSFQRHSCMRVLTKCQIVNSGFRIVRDCLLGRWTWNFQILSKNGYLSRSIHCLLQWTRLVEIIYLLDRNSYLRLSDVSLVWNTSTLGFCSYKWSQKGKAASFHCIKRRQSCILHNFPDPSMTVCSLILRLILKFLDIR